MKFKIYLLGLPVVAEYVRFAEVAPGQTWGFEPSVIVGNTAVNSSAPISGVVAFLVVPSISVVTVAIGVPAPSKLQLLAVFKWRSVADKKVGLKLREFVLPPNPL